MRESKINNIFIHCVAIALLLNPSCNKLGACPGAEIETLAFVPAQTLSRTPVSIEVQLLSLNPLYWVNGTIKGDACISINDFVVGTLLSY